MINYRDNSFIKKIWILWNAEDSFFPQRRTNSNAGAVEQKKSKKEYSD